MKYLGLWSPGYKIFFEKFVKPSSPRRVAKVLILYHFKAEAKKCYTGIWAVAGAV